MRERSAAVLAVGIAAVSCAAVLIRLCPAPALSIAAWRLILAAAGFLAAGRLHAADPSARLHPGDRPAAIAAGTFLALHFATWISSLQYTSVAASVVLVTTNPIFVGLGSWLILKEPVARSLIVGTAVSMAGGILVGWSGAGGAGRDPLLGDALALAGAVCGSAYMLIGRRVQARADTFPYVTAVYTTAAVALAVLALAAGAPLAGFAARTWVLLGLIALIPQGVGHTIINWSLRRLEPATVALFLLGEPVGATLLAWMVLGEAPGGIQVAGGLLVLAGVALALRAEPAGVPVG